MKSISILKNKRVNLLVVTAVASAGLVAAGVAFTEQAQRRERSQHLRDESAVVLRQDVIVKVSSTGSIKPLISVNISPKASGRVAALFVDQGDHVKKGQILARMDGSNLVGTLLKAKGMVASIQDNLKEAAANMLAITAIYSSNQELIRNGVVSRNDFTASQGQYLAMKAHLQSLRDQLIQAKGDLETAEASMEDTIIRAPFAGVITQKYANVGAFVTPTTSASSTTSATSSSILSLASPLEAVANVSEIDQPSIYKGQPVLIHVDAYPDLRVRGRVRLIAPESVVVQNVTSFEVHITINHEDQAKLRSGMTITADFLVGRHRNALLIPTPAIVSQREGAGVYIVTGTGKPHFQRIRVGATIGAMTEVTSGVHQGQRVLITFPGARKPNSRPVTSSSPFNQQGGGRMPR